MSGATLSLAEVIQLTRDELYELAKKAAFSFDGRFPCVPQCVLIVRFAGALREGEIDEDLVVMIPDGSSLMLSVDNAGRVVEMEIQRVTLGSTPEPVDPPYVLWGDIVGLLRMRAEERARALAIVFVQAPVATWKTYHIDPRARLQLALDASGVAVGCLIDLPHAKGDAIVNE